MSLNNAIGEELAGLGVAGYSPYPPYAMYQYYPPYTHLGKLRFPVLRADNKTDNWKKEQTDGRTDGQTSTFTNS